MTQGSEFSCQHSERWNVCHDRYGYDYDCKKSSTVCEGDIPREATVSLVHEEKAIDCYWTSVGLQCGETAFYPAMNVRDGSLKLTFEGQATTTLVVTKDGASRSFPVVFSRYASHMDYAVKLAGSIKDSGQRDQLLSRVLRDYVGRGIGTLERLKGAKTLIRAMSLREQQGHYLRLAETAKKDEKFALAVEALTEIKDPDIRKSKLREIFDVLVNGDFEGDLFSTAVSLYDLVKISYTAAEQNEILARLADHATTIGAPETARELCERISDTDFREVMIARLVENIILQGR